MIATISEPLCRRTAGVVKPCSIAVRCAAAAIKAAPPAPVTAAVTIFGIRSGASAMNTTIAMAAATALARENVR